MSKLIKYLITILIGVILGIICCDICYKKHFKRDETITKIEKDTVIFRDTIRIEKPIEKYIAIVDTLYLPLRDTVTVKDTTYILLERISKTYSDSTYTLQVSGYQPALDWIEVYPTRVVITEKIIKNNYKKFRWGIGVQVGYGASIHNSKVNLAPYVGVGISYNFIRW